ncbi:hypothetical protein Tco_1354366 [Tanacetum coccineum]
MSLGAEVRMRAEYNVKERRRLKSVVEKQDELLKSREREIENLKAQLLLREAEAAEAIRLRTEASNFGAIEKSLWDETNALRERNVILEKERNALDVKVTELEASAASKGRELTDLNAQLSSIKSQNDNLVDRVHELEVSSFGLQEKITVYEDCMGQLEKFQDDRIKEVNDKFDKMYADFIEMALHLEERFYPHLLTKIFGRRWLLTYGMKLAIAKCLNSLEYLSALGAAIGKAIEKGMQDGLSAGITHGTEGRALTDVVAYNPSAEADYISALQQLQNVNFSLLAELRSNKDDSIDTLMNILRLEETLAERLSLTEAQPHVDQLMVPIHHSPDKVVVGATALSLALDVSNIWVWKIKENITNQRLALRDVFVPLSEPFSAEILTGAEGTSDAVPATADTTTALSTTFASASTIAPISVDDYEVVGTDDQADADGNAKPFPNVDDAELNIPHCFPSWSLNMYAPFPSASVTSYGPSYLGPSFPVSSARLTLLLRLTSKASLFCVMSISVVLSVGMPISAGMTASIPYVNENGVYPLLDFIMVYEPDILGTLLSVPLHPYAWYREYDLTHLKLIFEPSIYKVWKSVRYGVSKELDMVYWGFLGVGITLDIFQNIKFVPYIKYGVLSISGYGVLSFILCGLWVSSVRYGYSKNRKKTVKNRTNTDTGKEREYKSRENAIKVINSQL